MTRASKAPAAPMPPPDRLRAEIRRGLEARACPEHAAPMQSYMKSAMPCLGVHADEVRAVVKRATEGKAFADLDALSATLLRIFRGATHREERYAAIAIAATKAARPFQTPAILPTYEAMIVEGAWWDLVDELASHRVGGLLAAHPTPMKATMRAWARDENLWKRRTAILSQIRHRERTDRELLYDCIEPSIGSKEFFLRKAIGWALRSYAYVEPDEVLRYVRAHASELSGLSKREALKTQLKAGAIDAVP